MATIPNQFRESSWKVSRIEIRLIMRDFANRDSFLNLSWVARCSAQYPLPFWRGNLLSGKNNRRVFGIQGAIRAGDTRPDVGDIFFRSPQSRSGDHSRVSASSGGHGTFLLVQSPSDCFLPIRSMVELRPASGQKLRFVSKALPTLLDSIAFFAGLVNEGEDLLQQAGSQGR